jgi:hypothetical protein
MIMILTPQDHAARGHALASVTPGSRMAPIEAPPIPANPPGGAIDTLTLWGHGEQYKFCDRTGADIARLVGEWKKVHPQIKTLELITCNARHFTTHTDAMADQVKTGLRSGFMNACRDIAVKALPVTVSGKFNAWSILLADTTTKSWVYVTAPGVNDAELQKAQSLIRFTTTPSGGKVSFTGDIAARADQMVRANPTRTWTMNYGYFNTLRAHLGVV